MIIEDGELHGRDAACLVAVGIVEEGAGRRVVDDAVVGVVRGGGAGGGEKGARRERAGGRESAVKTAFSRSIVSSEAKSATWSRLVVGSSAPLNT